MIQKLKLSLNNLKMEKNNSYKFKLGLFVIIGMTLFIIATYYIGNKQNMFGKTFNIQAIFNNANGLQIGCNVRYSGVSVGTVKGIEMYNDTTVKVDMIINNEFLKHIKRDAIASINSDGLVGNMIINISPGKNSNVPIEPGDVLISSNRLKTDDALNTLNVSNENVALLSADLLKITHQITSGNGLLGSITYDSLLVKDLKEILQYIKITGQKTGASMSSLNKLIHSLDNKDNIIGVLKDTSVANQVKAIINNLENSSLEIDSVVSNLNSTVSNFKDGNGVFDYLSNDTMLVQKIDSTMYNINEASILLNQNLEALKHNFLLRGFFKKQEKLKSKEQNK